MKLGGKHTVNIFFNKLTRSDRSWYRMQYETRIVKLDKDILALCYTFAMSAVNCGQCVTEKGWKKSGVVKSDGDGYMFGSPIFFSNISGITCFHDTSR